jgi:hypothetical protein
VCDAGLQTSGAVLRQRSSLPPGHPLLRLQRRRLARGRLRLLPGPTSRFGALYFSVHLERGGSLSREPILTGLHHSGPYASYNWIEVAQVNDHLTFESSSVGLGIVISAASLRRLMALLGELIPPGGHLMLEYESPRWSSTARALNLGVPPAATELGDLLRAAGCAASIRNWYIPEGGREGPRKLQGFKPLDVGRARSAREARDRELREFLASLAPGARSSALADARRRARRLLRSSRA